MKINSISSLGTTPGINARKQNFGASKVETISVGDKKYQFIMKDENDIARAYNISDPKIGAKYILKLNNPDFKNSRFLIDETSEITSFDGRFYVSLKEKKDAAPKNDVSFKGKVWGSIRSDERGVDDNMKLAYKEFWTSGLKNYVETSTKDKEDIPDVKDDYNFFIPSDGDGTRYRDMTLLQGDITVDENDKVVRDEKGAIIPKRSITKPASAIPSSTPNGQNMKLVQGILANFQRAGEVEDVNFIEVKPAQGSAYALFEGLKSGSIPTDKPLVFSWGDNFSDINIRKIMKEHEASDADFTMLALPVTRDRIGALGAVQVKSEEDMEALWFMEKPQTDEEKDKAKLPNKDEYLGIVGPYILSPKTLNWIKESYTENPEAFHNAKGYDFSSTIIDTLVNKKDQLKDDFKVQVYRKPEDETWSDLGAVKDFKDEMAKLKAGNSYNDLPKGVKGSIESHIDENGNIGIGNGEKALLYSSLIHGINFKNVIAYE